MMKLLRPLLAAWLMTLAPISGFAAGSLPIALQQTVDSNGKPMVGAKLYIYQVGTVSTPQLAYSDTSLTVPLPSPLQTDSNGRFPMFYLADGSVHVRMTDSAGNVQFDYPNMLVIGPSGGGGGGSSIDATSVATTGDVKWRQGTEALSGWVKLNGTTVGNATSGATGRANGDTQAIFIWLWTNCPDAKCAVSSGRGASALADFNANKTITLPKYQGRTLAGLNDMGGSDQNIIQSVNVTSGGGDGPTTAGAWGGEAVHSLSQSQLPAVSPTFTGTAHGALSVSGSGSGSTSTVYSPFGTTGSSVNFGSGFAPIVSVSGAPYAASVTVTVSGSTSSFTPAGTISSLGSGVAMNVMSPFILGTYYMKL